jgi:hypothetical protein
MVRRVRYHPGKHSLPPGKRHHNCSVVMGRSAASTTLANSTGFGSAQMSRYSLMQQVGLRRAPNFG